MAMSGGKDDGSTIMEMNTTLLIDVMLVLLIIFIITIPVATHSVDIDLPVPSPQDNPPPVDPIKNKILIMANGTVLWNGTPTNLQQLRQYLDISQQMNPLPELHLQPEPTARYELVDEVLVVTKQARVEKMGFVGNEAYANF